tara:strand:- start:934 stop:2223 length:1290 start_codon:yes stop_codon:yes gene_type:complete
MPHVSSYYAASANQKSHFESLSSDIKTHVCVIGGGFTGLNTAISLAEKNYDVVLIESEKIGWGASGRNGGQLISGFTFSDYFSKHLSFEEAHQIWKIGAVATDIVRQRVNQYGISCDLKEGFIEVAMNASQMRELIERKEDWQTKGYQHQLSIVEESSLKDHVISDRYIGGLIDSGSGHLHPLNLCLGEAQAAKNLGVKIYEQTKALSFEAGEAVTIHTKEGSIKAENLVLAGNAYIGNLQKKLRRMIFPASSCIIATEPLNDKMVNETLPSDMAVCDLNTILDYYRLSSDRRMLFGGRYNYSGAEPDDTGIRKHIRSRMLKVFPSLENLKIDYAWSGNVAVTMNRIPQLGKLDQNIFYAQGYSGHGVAPTHAAAEIISNGIINEDKSLNILNRVPHVQLPGGKWFSSPAMAIGMMYYQFRDLLSNYTK